MNSEFSEVYGVVFVKRVIVNINGLRVAESYAISETTKLNEHTHLLDNFQLAHTERFGATKAVPYIQKNSISK